MKMITDFQIEVVVMEDGEQEKIENAINRYGGIDKYQERLKELMNDIFSNTFGVLLNKSDVKVKTFMLEKGL